MTGPTATPSDWVRVPGRARYYRNIHTGEVIPRSRYDREFGRLVKTGFRNPYQQAKANKTKWRGFYVERFQVSTNKRIPPQTRVDNAWSRLMHRIKELGHRSMYVSAHGEAGYDYPTRAGQMIWVSSVGFMGYPAATLHDFQYAEREGVWVWEQLAVGALITETIDEFVLRWLP